MKDLSEPKTFLGMQIEGILLYLAGAARPDILYAVNVLSRTQANPSYEIFTTDASFRD